MEALTAAGTVRNLAARAVMAASVDMIDRASRHQLDRAAVDSRGAILAQQREIIRTAFYRAIDLAFDASPGGVLLGVHADGRTRFPLPWSGRSYLRYSLTRTTADILRVLVLDWPAGFWRNTTGRPPSQPAPIFVTDNRGAWFLNHTYTTKIAVTVAITDWPTYDAIAWLQADLSLKASREREQRRARQRSRKRAG